MLFTHKMIDPETEYVSHSAAGGSCLPFYLIFRRLFGNLKATVLLATN